MPLFYQQDINETTRLGVWQITEEESFFLEKVPLSREITHPHKRLQHLAGRYLLQVLFPDFPYDLIKIADTRKPYLEDEAYHFSISHCGDMAAALVSKSLRVGVDVEEATPRIDRILKKFLHPDELEWLGRYPVITGMEDKGGEDRSVHLLPTLLWSAKESVFKWYGSGQVDFSDHIRLEPFDLKQEGNIIGNFCKAEPFPFMLQYKLFGNFCLSWVKGNYTG
jgi:4'-phosphopantetheinyl transferase EntD